MDDNVFSLCLDSIVKEVANQGVKIDKIVVSSEVYRQHGHLQHGLKYPLKIGAHLQGYQVQVEILSNMPFLDHLLGDAPILDLLQVVETYEVRSRFDRL